MKTMELSKIKKYWPTVGMYVHPIETEEDYEKTSELVLKIMDTVKEDTNHPLDSLLGTLTVLMDDFEKKHHPLESKSDPVKTLLFLMDQHGLKQKDLPEIGSQGIVSEILSRKRKLNQRHLKALARRFGISIDSF